MGLILENETYEKFGYKIEELQPSSCKLVLWKCSECGLVKEQKYRSAKKFELCQVCSNIKNARNKNGLIKRSEKIKEWHKNNDHPLLGTTRPTHVIEALRKSATGRIISDETRLKMSIAVSGINNGFYGKKHTEETKLKASERQKICVRRGLSS